MWKKILAVAVCLTMLSYPVRAGQFFGDSDPQDKPSVINYAWAGMATGTLLGAAIGGIQAVEEHQQLDSSGEANRVSNGALYGLIGGTVLGLGIGFYDLSQGQTGVGGVVLKDMNIGGGLGIVIGAAAGGITYSKTKEWSDFGKSLAWGYIGGSVLGLVIGLIEGPQLVAANPGDNKIRLVLASDSEGNPSPQLQVSHRY